jgi:dipeptidyl-peptidase-4
VPSYSPTFEHVAFTFSNDLTPLDLYQQALANGQSSAARRITVSPGKEFERLERADVRYIEFKSHVDGASLHGRLYVPRGVDLAAGGKRYPLIVGSVYSDTVRNNWGGRSVHPTWGLDQCLVAGGYLVVSVNVRGSFGQGRAFREARREFGSLDVDDIESAVRHLIAKGYVDPARVGIWGSSYGGLMTTMSLFRKPGLYAAGIAGAPATNVWHAFPGEMRVMGEPSGEGYPERYRRQSSLYYVDGLEDPLMIIHGTKDDVVLYSDSIALAERLIAADKYFELVTLPGIGHPWDNEDIETTRFAFRKMVEFFDRYLKGTR